MLASALLDHAVAPFPPEVHQDRTLGIYFAMMSGEHMRRNGGAGLQAARRLHARPPRCRAHVDRHLPERRLLVPERHAREVVPEAHGRRVLAHHAIRLRRGRSVHDRGPRRAPHGRGHQRVDAPEVLRRRRAGRRADDRGGRPAVPGRSASCATCRSCGSCRSPTSGCRYTTDKSDSYRQEIVGDMMGLFLRAQHARTCPASASEVQVARAARAAGRSEGFKKVTAHAETLFDTRRTGRWRPAGTRRSSTRATARGSRSRSLALLFMLLPAVNLVNLNVSRIMERASEIGVRKSFGASSRVLVGQFLVENVALTLIGGAIGLRARGVAAVARERQRPDSLRRPAHELPHLPRRPGVRACSSARSRACIPPGACRGCNPVQALKGASR